MTEESKKYWDVLGENVNSDDLKRSVQNIRDRFEKFQKNPEKHIKEGKILGAITVLVFVGSVVSFFFISPENQEFFLIVSIMSVASLFGVSFAVFNSGAKSREEMTCLMFADKYGWLFNPENSIKRLNKFKKKFCILKLGDGEGIKNQYWGQAKIQGKATDFWLGLHSFSRGTGKSKKFYTNTLLAFRLPVIIEQPFYVREGSDRLFDKKDAQLESVEFNKEFVVNYSDDLKRNNAEIMQIVTPAVQQKFLELGKKIGNFTAEFSGDVALFSMSYDWLDVLSTSPIGKIEINPKDDLIMKERMKLLFSMVGELFKYID